MATGGGHRAFVLFGSRFAIVVLQLAIILMASSCIRCASSNGGGRFRQVLVEEEPPIGLVSAGGASKTIFNELLKDMEASLNQAARSPVTAAQSSSGHCRIELQVMKVMPGRCERLGKGNNRACVSGNHLIPFHPDCM